MATLTAIVPAVTGATLAEVAAAGGGDKFLNNGRKLLVVNNGDVAPITVTMDAAATTPVAGGTVAYTDPTNAVAAGARDIMGPFDPRVFNDAQGFVNISYSGVTSVTVAVIDIT